MLFGYKGYLMFNPVKQLIVMVYEAKIQFDALLDTCVRETFGHTFAVGFLADILSYLRKIVLIIGVLHMGNEFTPFADKMHSAAKEIPG